MIDCHHNYARLHEVLTLVAFAVYLSMVLLSIAYQKKQLKVFPNSKHSCHIEFTTFEPRPLVDVIIPNMPAKATKKKSRPIVTNY